jgi:AraC-like DNA-binding protein
MSRINELKDAIAQFATADGIQATAIDGLSIVRLSQPSSAVPSVATAALCIVAQGRKRVVAGDRVLNYDADNFLVITVDTPTIGQVVEASPEAPYLCIKMDLDPAEIAALLIDVGGLGIGAGDAEPSLAVSRVTDDLLDPAIRLVNLLGRPDDIAVLAPMVKREILYRLLRSDQATKLQQIAVAESRLQQVNRAIGWIKTNYREAFAIETLAAEARMSPSALHLHFKAVTAMSPLQYQKQLRLQEARRMMLIEAVDAATAGHRVGYDSPSQFSREYARVFGAPPLRDVARLKAGDLLAAG